VPGTAVYLTSDPSIVPSALFHNLKHFKVMHARTAFLNVVNEDVPRIEPEHRMQVAELASGVFSITLRFGFREEPDISAALADAAQHGIELDPMTTTYFVARSTHRRWSRRTRGLALCDLFLDDAAIRKRRQLLQFARESRGRAWTQVML